MDRLDFPPDYVPKPSLPINDEEAYALYDYFLHRAGWISYETDQKVHDFIKRLKEFLE